MIIFPAIDLFDGKVVRLLRGDYNQMTVYSNNPIDIANKFVSEGATHIHLVDLEGAKDGNTPNIQYVTQIANETPLFTEIGGGIRNIETVDKYLSCGVDRVILGTSAITDVAFLKEALKKYGERIAVGADIKNGKIAIKGWLEKSTQTADEFMKSMECLGVSTIICTDISKDGAMNGINADMYRELGEKYKINFTASGGVTDIEDIKRLAKNNVYGAIIGKAYYTGNINLKEAIEEAK